MTLMTVLKKEGLTEGEGGLMMMRGGGVNDDEGGVNDPGFVGWGVLMTLNF